jgi:transcriptional regulator with XRE-family HTH domain
MTMIQQMERSGRMVPQFTLADRLRKARDVTKLNQQEFGEIIGLSRKQIVNLENETTAARKPLVIAWAFATGVDVDWLLTGQESEKPTDPEGPDGLKLPDLDSNQEPSGSFPAGNVLQFTQKNSSPISDKKAA